MVMLVIILPIVAAILVGIIVKDIAPRKGVCPPHSWSQVHGTDRMQCILCNRNMPINPSV